MKKKVFLSYDMRRLVNLLPISKPAAASVKRPVYSHHSYDIVPGAENGSNSQIS